MEGGEEEEEAACLAIGSDWTPPATSPISRHFLLSFLPNRARQTRRRSVESPASEPNVYIPSSNSRFRLDELVAPILRRIFTPSCPFTFPIAAFGCAVLRDKTSKQTNKKPTQSGERMANKGPSYGLSAEVRSKVSETGRAFFFPPPNICIKILNSLCVAVGRRA